MNFEESGKSHESNRFPAAMVFLYAFVSMLCLCAALGIFLIRFQQSRFVSRLADQVLRFHVIANSDSDKDQAVKLEVRDALISYMAGHADTFRSAGEAAAYAAAHTSELEQVANAVLSANDASYTAAASLCLCDFPEKQYGDLTFPAGRYQALRIELGEARGQNWWCVLYPLLCYTKEGLVSVPEESEVLLQETLSEEDYSRLTGSSSDKPVIRIKLLEWIQELLGQS